MNKILIFSAALCFAICTPIPITPQSTDPPDAFVNSGVRVIILSKKTTSVKPKMPSVEHGQCTYRRDTMTFELPSPEGQCIFTLNDNRTNEVVTGKFDSHVIASVVVGIHPTGTISVRTQAGNIYTGTW